MKKLSELESEVKGNLLITGGFGQVAQVVLQLLEQDKEAKNFDTIYIMDLVSEEYAKSVMDELPKLNIVHLKQSYNKDLDYFLLDNDITSVIHLVAESSQPIWRAITKVQDKTNKVITYVDASMYVSSYSSKLDNPKYRLNSNFELFDNELKAKYHDKVCGIVATGANPYILTNCLTHSVIYGNNKLNNIPKGGFGTKGLKGLYCIEKDRVTSDLPTADNEFVISWSPFSMVEECTIENANYYSKNLCYMSPNKVASQVNAEFSFGDGDVVTDATMTVHEEIRVMCKRYGVEGSFLYSVPSDTRKKLKKVENGELNPLDAKYRTISPLTDNTVKGTDKLGMLLVYEDKEIAIYDESGNFGFTSGVSYQVGVGVFTPWKILNQMVRKGKAEELKLDWGEFFLDKPEFKKKQIKLMDKYFNLQVNITPTDGFKLLKDRIKETDVRWDCINPEPQMFDDKDFLPHTDHEDIYIDYIEDAIYEEYECDEDSEDNEDSENNSDEENQFCENLLIKMNQFILTGQLVGLKCDTEEIFFDSMLKSFELYIGNDVIKTNKKTLLNVELSEVENMLLDEDIAEKEEIINFIMKDLITLINKEYDTEEDLIQDCYYLFKKIKR